MGDDVQLLCTVTSDNVYGDAMAVIEWKRNEEVINSSTVPIAEAGQFHHTFLHHIINGALSDSGEYYCTASIASTIDTPYLTSSDAVTKYTDINIMSKSAL